LAGVNGSSLPRIEFTEQVMREGMQIESVDISVATKIELLDLLSQTGLKRIVVGAFVSPKYTPQMAEIDEIVGGFLPAPGVNYSALALNEKGRERARRYTPPLAPETEAVPLLYAHLCDTFVRRNVNISQEHEIANWPQLIEAALERRAERAGIGIGAAFGSNFEGPFTNEQRMEMFHRQHEQWAEAGIPVRNLVVADPMGWVTPWAVEELLHAVLRDWPEIDRFDLHLHNSRGLALASTYEAIRILDERHEVHFDTAAGGIGGCPYCGNGRATGMVATEDFVNMLEEMGVDTGVDLDALIRFVWRLEGVLERPAFGFVSKAGPHPRGSKLYDANLPLVETLDEAKHFLLGTEVVEHQLRPWREPIPIPVKHGG
jgi:hydroxymethylglutaryl-CoA lyase